MQPRIIGNATTPAVATVTQPPSFSVINTTSSNVPAVRQQGWDGNAVIPNNFGVGLAAGQLQSITKQVNELSIHNLSLLDISTLASDVEQNLHKSLGLFLDRIDKGNNPAIFKLVSDLNREVKEQDLGGLADKILNGKPGLMASIIGKLSPAKRQETVNDFYEHIRSLVSAKTQKLTGVLDKMEREVSNLSVIAMGEAKNFEALKENYRARFGEFAAATVFLNTFLAKAKDELAELQRQEQSGELPAGLTVQDATDKVQALESRALAVEGVFTNLPAEQLVISQIQTATIQTVQEVTTTTSGRFASIKMALITIHGAMQTQNLQRISQQGADLDANMASVRNRLVSGVVTSAANAPGDNRIKQAEQLRAVVENTQELQKVIEQARVDNQEKFAKAREMLATARNDLTVLGAVIRPDKQLKF